MNILTDKLLSQSAFSHELDIPFDQIDIADWLFNLPEAEYQRCCPPDHIAAGTTLTDDGRKMSINVEIIGTSFVVQHISRIWHCPVRLFAPLGKRICLLVRRWAVSSLLSTPPDWMNRLR